MFALVAQVLLVFALFFGATCGDLGSSRPVTGSEDSRIRAELAGRSFRQFEDSVDSNPRKGVIINFTGPVGLWAQYAEDGHAVDEWEIVADDYRIEEQNGESTITVHFMEPRSKQQFPTVCDDCIPTDGVSVSIRNVFDEERIAFRVNDPVGMLPSPFPVFGSWTKFREDEYFD